MADLNDLNQPSQTSSVNNEVLETFRGHIVRLWKGDYTGMANLVTGMRRWVRVGTTNVKLVERNAAGSEDTIFDSSLKANSSDVTTQINLAVATLIPSGTRMPFAQASAPSGWTQDTSDNASNRMLRVVNTAGNGIGGSASPILNNVVPAHTHGFTTGAVSADHAHYVSGYTSGSGNHQHGINRYTNTGSNQNGFGGGDNGSFSATNYTAAGGDHNHSFAAWTGGINVNHTHSGSTDNGSSQTNWSPRYIDMIICSKN